ncbi:hypothetical protein D3C78_20010 [compost metagenome]
MTNDKQIAQAIYDKYHEFYDGETQGCCAVIAMEITKTIDGVAVAGYIDYYRGERSHWWVEKDGQIYDPMTEYYFSKDPHRHVEVHRDQAEFLKVYNNYKQYEII